MAEIDDLQSGRAVTVVIAAYDQVATLEETVESVRAQQGDVAVRILIVVDACPHGTAELAAALAQRWHTSVETVLLERNVGQAGARDVGLQHVVTPWVLFLDGDDRLRPDGVSSMIDAAAAAKASAVFARLVKFTERDGILAPDRRQAQTGHHEIMQWFRPRAASLGIRSFLTDFRLGAPGCWLLSTKETQEIGGFDPDLRSNEDLEFVVRLLGRATPTEIHHVVLEKRVHDAQQTANRALQRRTNVAALWRVLRRSTTHRPDVVRGIIGCYELRSRTVLSYRSSSRVPKAIGWALCSALVWPVAWAESLLRLVKGPLPSPEWATV